jgi:hypothetical protein
MYRGLYHNGLDRIIPWYDHAAHCVLGGEPANKAANSSETGDDGSAGPGVGKGVEDGGRRSP